jgi:hypothetical protein
MDSGDDPRMSLIENTFAGVFIRPDTEIHP